MDNICPSVCCTGCAACFNICPKSAITMLPDKLGHLHPVIDNKLCIDCELCLKTCPINQKMIYRKPKVAYSAWSLDSKDRGTSTSGGIASVFASQVLSQQGVVYGAAITEGINVSHIRVDKISDLPFLKKSKYVHSHVNNSYKLAKKDLQKGRLVLFIGTPCQIAGLKSFLKIDYNNLLTVDLICHGVPSQQILHDHIKSVTKCKEVEIVHFRGKDEYNLLLTNKKGNIIYNKDLPYDKYLNGFMSNLFCRESCLQCRFSKLDRISDITIGDFWGLGKLKSVKYPTDKVSVILPLTAKGEEFIKKCKDKIFLEERLIQEAYLGNANLQLPSKPHLFYGLFKKIYPILGYTFSVNACLLVNYIKLFVSKIIGKIRYIYNLN